MNDFSQKREFKLEKENVEKIKESFCSESLSENETRLIISEIYKNNKMLIDPHTAVGIGVTQKIPLKEKTIVLSTAHPSKFSDVVAKETGVEPNLPESLQGVLTKKEEYKRLPKNLENLKKYILKQI